MTTRKPCQNEGVGLRAKNVHANKMYPKIFAVFYIEHNDFHIFNHYLDPGFLNFSNISKGNFIARLKV